MIRIKFAVVALFALALGTLSAQAQQATQAGVAGVLPDGKIAVINTQLFPEKIGELRQKYEQINNKYKERYNSLNGKAQQVSQLESEMKTKAGTVSPEQYQAMQNRYNDMKKQTDREVQDYQEEINRELESATRPVRDKLQNFINNYATQRGIVVIIDLPGAAQTGSLAYVNESVNITDDFINEYNKANPVPAGAAPATAAPAQPRKP